MLVVLLPACWPAFSKLRENGPAIWAAPDGSPIGCFQLPSCCCPRLPAACSKAREEGDHLWERQVWSYFLQAALGVQHLHHSHILHR